MPPEQVPGDELLQTGGWSRRTRAAIALGVLVVAVGLVIGLTRDDHTSSAQHSAAPSAAPTASSAPALTGNDVLVPGQWTDVSSGPFPHHERLVVAVAELVSSTDRRLTVLYPISVTGVDSDNAVSVEDAELTAGRTNGSFLPPRPLTTIPARAHVEVWMKLRITCDGRKVSFHRAAVSIALLGTSEPAVFRFPDLFGSQLPQRPTPCRRV